MKLGFFRVNSPLFEDSVWKHTPSKLIESDRHYIYYVKAPHVSLDEISIRFIEDRIIVDMITEGDNMHWDDYDTLFRFKNDAVSCGVSLQSPVNHEKTTTKINNGVIEICIPKIEKSKY